MTRKVMGQHMKNIGKYEKKEFPASRLFTIDVCQIGSKKHYVQALVEFDVTKARGRIKEIKQASPGISFNAWLLKCVSEVCSEYKEIHGLQGGRRDTVVFEDVDISIIIEREVNGKRVPLPYILRKTNEKTIADIHQEIQDAQNQDIAGEGDYVLGEKWNNIAIKSFCMLPGFIRRLTFKAALSNPKLVKQNMGTVAFTSLGMMGRFRGWVIPIGVHPLIFGVGSIHKAPMLIDGKIETREFLKVTMLVDHDVVDGAPAIRALSKLTRLIENASGL
jgi:pyruvate/2-oxoglutarate dehydrogenase complex dihydrolipoamide acyltransferase (E2) component